MSKIGIVINLIMICVFAAVSGYLINNALKNMDYIELKGYITESECITHKSSYDSDNKSYNHTITYRVTANYDLNSEVLTTTNEVSTSITTSSASSSSVIEDLKGKSIYVWLDSDTNEVQELSFHNQDELLNFALLVTFLTIGVTLFMLCLQVFFGLRRSKYNLENSVKSFNDNIKQRDEDDPFAKYDK